MKYAWKILEIRAKDGLITAARYLCVATEKDVSVDTEGWWQFAEPKANIPFADVTEEMVIDWIKKEAVRDGKQIMEARLAEQVKAVSQQTTAIPPWMPQTFTPEL